MNANTWGKVSTLKANLLGLIDSLLHDKEFSREEIALELLNNIHSLNNIEEELVKEFYFNQHRKLYNLCEQKELEREQKRASSDGEERLNRELLQTTI